MTESTLILEDSDVTAEEKEQIKQIYSRSYPRGTRNPIFGDHIKANCNMQNRYGYRDIADYFTMFSRHQVQGEWFA